LLHTSSTSGQSNLRKRLHRRRTWTVQSYSPGGTNVHPHLTRTSLNPTESKSKTALDRFSRFSGLTIVTDRRTVSNNRPRLRTMRSKTHFTPPTPTRQNCFVRSASALCEQSWRQFSVVFKYWRLTSFVESGRRCEHVLRELKACRQCGRVVNSTTSVRR